MEGIEVKTRPGTVEVHSAWGWIDRDPGQARELAGALTRAADEAEKPPEIKVLTPTGRHLVMRVPYMGAVEIAGFERDGSQVGAWSFRISAMKDFIRACGVLLEGQE